MVDVWVAIDMYPESTTVHVAGTKQAAYEAIRDEINPDEWESFQDSIRRGDEPGGDLGLNGPTEEVVAHYWGDGTPAPEVHPDAVVVGESWLIHPATIREEEN